MLFSTGELLPIRGNLEDGLKSISENANRVKKSYGGGKSTQKKILKAMQRVNTCVRNLQQLILLCKMGGLDLSTNNNNPVSNTLDSSSSPSIVTIDLGLRQKEKHYDGGLFYTAVLYSSTGGKKSENQQFNSGLRACEGGRYDELVGKYRPPNVSSRNLPIAAGVRFHIGRIVESFYYSAAEKKQKLIKMGKGNSATGIEGLYAGLGVPYFTDRSMVSVVIAGVNGLGLCPAIFERFLVASRLWKEGVSCEYLANSR